MIPSVFANDDPARFATLHSAHCYSPPDHPEMLVLLSQTRPLKASTMLVIALRGINGKMDRAVLWR